MKRIHPVKAAGEFSQAAAASWTAGFLQFQGRSFVEPGCRVIVDAARAVGEQRLGVDVVELGGRDQLGRIERVRARLNRARRDHRRDAHGEGATADREGS